MPAAPSADTVVEVNRLRQLGTRVKRWTAALDTATAVVLALSIVIESALVGTGGDSGP